MQTKICPKCNRELPLTKEYFFARSDTKSGFKSHCKDCSKKYNQEQRPNYYFSYMAKDKKDVIGSTYKHSECKKLSKAELAEKRAEYEKSEKGKAAIERRKTKEWYKLSKQRRNEKYRNSEKGKEKLRQLNQIRKANKKQVTAKLTIEEWLICKEYFNNKCAYCGKEKTLDQEHFIALSNGGEYTKQNIIPACKSCNCSKCDKDFFEWYPSKDFYSADKEEKILNYLGYKNKVQQLSLI